MNMVGKRVIGRYVGQFLCCGDVVDVRVTRGGRAEYTVELIKPIEVYGEMREVVALRDTDIEAAWIPDAMETV
jgi:hypothetical protein